MAEEGKNELKNRAEKAENERILGLKKKNKKKKSTDHIQLYNYQLLASVRERKLCFLVLCCLYFLRALNY